MINIYGQLTYHDEAEIIGTREGLRILADTINAALEYGNDSEVCECEVFASDGERYLIKVRAMSESEFCKEKPIYTLKLNRQRIERLTNALENMLQADGEIHPGWNAEYLDAVWIRKLAEHGLGYSIENRGLRND